MGNWESPHVYQKKLIAKFNEKRYVESKKAIYANCKDITVLLDFLIKNTNSYDDVNQTNLDEINYTLMAVRQNLEMINKYINSCHGSTKGIVYA